MPITCTWCKREFGYALEGTPAAEQSGPGVCRECREQSWSGLSAPVWSFLDLLPNPIVVADGAGRVVYANQQALALVGKPDRPAPGLLLGEVFECVNAKQPVGCGRTVHCAACALRRAALETVQTGTPVNLVCAVVRRQPDQQEEEVALMISTQRVFGMVMLRIDDVLRRPAPAQETPPAEPGT